jgi:hypothetical protein
MEMNYRNKNRGYQQLRVWQDAIDFYSAHRDYELTGGCVGRESVLECGGWRGRGLTPLSARAMPSQAKAACALTPHPPHSKTWRQCERFMCSLERKEMQGDWIDHLILKESNIAYGGSG